MTDLTVAICTYRRPAKLREALRALSRQSILPALEVLVVDDGSQDSTPGVVREFPFATLVQHPANRGLAAARNTALRAAGAPWVLFTDDDCRPHPTWAASIRTTIDAWPNAFAVGGGVTAAPAPGIINAFLRMKSPFVPLELSLVERSGFWHRLKEYLKRSAGPADALQARRVVSVSGASMAVRTDAALAIGGWDERFVFGGEEEEQFRRAAQEGLDIAFDPAPLVEHDFDNTLRDLVTRSFWYGRGNFRARAKHGGLPTLYPAPVVVLAGLAGSRRVWPAVVAVLVPHLVFSVWPRRAWEQRSPSILLFPYLQVLQEAASDVGWVYSWATESARFDSTPADAGTARPVAQELV